MNGLPRPSSVRAAPPIGEARAVFARLGPLLARCGLDADLAEPDTAPLLLVSNDGRPATFVYVATPPGREPAVYGFVDLYLGPAADLARVAARLAWLLGAPIAITASTANPLHSPPDEENDA